MYQNDPKRVLTPECRLSYIHLFEPVPPKNNPTAEPKYSAALLIPKDTGIKEELDSAFEAAAREAVNTVWGGVRPPVLVPVVHDGDGVKQSGEPYGPECKGCWVLNVSSKKTSPPYVCHIKNKSIRLTDSLDAKSGDYARVSINFYAYNRAGKRGIGAGLRAVLITREGEPLSGTVVTASEFEGIGDDMGVSAPTINPLNGQPM